VHKLEKL